MFKLSKKSLSKLQGVHPDLVRVVERAIQISEIDFCVLEGVRTLARQKELVASGASWTLKGRHVAENNLCKMSCAVDLGAMILGKVKWDWPLYYKISSAMFIASKELNIPIEWGGNWKGKNKDGPHFQLPWKDYP